MSGYLDASANGLRGRCHVEYLTFHDARRMGSDHDGAESRIKDGDRPGRGTMQPMQCDAISPYGRPALDHDQRATRNVRHWRQRVRGRDRFVDADGVKDELWDHFHLPPKQI